jgi:hypothetical protein
MSEFIFVYRFPENYTARRRQHRYGRAGLTRWVPACSIRAIPSSSELPPSDVSVYTLMKLLGHESMVTAQRYVTAAGTETRAAAAQNRLQASNRRSRNVKADCYPALTADANLIVGARNGTLSAIR